MKDEALDTLVRNELSKLDWDRFSMVVKHVLADGHVEVGIHASYNDTPYYFDVREECQHEVPEYVRDAARTWYEMNSRGHYVYINSCRVERVETAHDRIFKSLRGSTE